MGFEPFIPRRVVPKEEPASGSRDERVLKLAKMLHERGITVSIADAKRLAEGMVDVERKVIKAPVKEEPKPVKSPVATIKEEPKPAKPSLGLKLPDDFAHFVAHAAAISHEEVRPSISIPTREEKPMTYGREEQQTIASVPHVHAHKQMFFEDAPDLSKARGFKGSDVVSSGPRTAHYETQQAKPTPPPETTVVRVTTGDEAVKVTKVETSPTATMVEEKMIVAEPTPEPAPLAALEPIAPAAELLAEDLKDAPEKTEELPKAAPQPKVDLAKQHGVDLFEMFKKKA